MTNEMDDPAVNESDQQGVKLALVVLAIQTPLAPVAAGVIGNPILGVGLFSFALGLVAAFFALQRLSWNKPMIAAALLLQTMAITAAFEGHPWQIDTHMIYFAVLAVISVMYEVRVLLASAAFVAIHHLAMSIVMPTMLYPDMTEGFIARTVFHGAVVVLETIILALSIQQRHEISQQVSAQRDEVMALSEASQAAERAAQEGERAVTEVVELFQDHLQKLAAQDLSQKIEGQLPSQYDDLRKTFNYLVENLGSVLRMATETSADFSISSKELSSSADDLAQRTERQSSTLSETAERLQELTKALQETADGAGKANDTAAVARSNAQKNGDIVEQAVEAMKQITESSSEISSIISLIEDIAFQTNLLALNAGVEAARAGESGRGFAVVASEVRALAQRTSEAASSVKQLIEKSSQEVKKGSGLVNAAGEALDEIVGQVTDASAMIGNITQSVNHQAGVVHSLNDAVQSLDTATQHNAAMCEEMTAMGQQLANGANSMKQALSGFQFESAVAQRLAG
ncbi:methyl-accepting chemotaxis protein [Yoonia sp. BS5-3]|uniref:Methyl-accepting chemotaxis protein n=1 Tax=Yoonia phaeophyticola TaxID=3137369 RepID=A0ABZ2V5T3_9RHOB